MGARQPPGGRPVVPAAALGQAQKKAQQEETPQEEPTPSAKKAAAPWWTKTPLDLRAESFEFRNERDAQASLTTPHAPQAASVAAGQTVTAPTASVPAAARKVKGRLCKMVPLARPPPTAHTAAQAAAIAAAAAAAVHAEPAAAAAAPSAARPTDAVGRVAPKSGRNPSGKAPAEGAAPEQANLHYQARLHQAHTHWAPTRTRPQQPAQAVARKSSRAAMPPAEVHRARPQAHHLLLHRGAVVARMVAHKGDRSQARTAEQTTGAVPAAAGVAATLAGAAGAAAAGEETPHSRHGPHNVVAVTHTRRAAACARVADPAGAGTPRGTAPSATQAPETAPTEQPKAESAHHGYYNRAPRGSPDRRAGPSHPSARRAHPRQAVARPARIPRPPDQAQHLEAAASGSPVLGAVEPPPLLLPRSPPRQARPGPREIRWATRHRQWTSHRRYRLQHSYGLSRGGPRQGRLAAARHLQRG